MEHHWLAASPLELARQLEALAARLIADADAIRRTVAETPPPPTAASGEPLLDIKELADRLGISRTAIYSLRNEGSGPPFIRIGNRVRYRPSDVDTWLANNTQSR
jgi:excisionase family DNA binding protein